MVLARLKTLTRTTRCAWNFRRATLVRSNKHYGKHQEIRSTGSLIKKFDKQPDSSAPAPCEPNLRKGRRRCINYKQALQRLISQRPARFAGMPLRAVCGFAMSHGIITHEKRHIFHIPLIASTLPQYLPEKKHQTLKPLDATATSVGLPPSKMLCAVSFHTCRGQHSCFSVPSAHWKEPPQLMLMQSVRFLPCEETAAANATESSVWCGDGQFELPRRGLLFLKHCQGSL